MAVYDRETGKRLHLAAHYGDIVQLDFSVDGRALVYTRMYTPGDGIEDNETVVPDVASGRERQSWYVEQLAASVAGNVLAIRRAGHVEIYEIEKLAKKQELNAKSARVLALSPDARRLATIVATRSDPELQLIEPSSGAVSHANKPESRSALASAWSRDGTLLATGHGASTVPRSRPRREERACAWIPT